MYKLRKFEDFFPLNEQEETDNATSAKEEEQSIGGLIKSTLKEAFGEIGEDGSEGDFKKASEYQAQPYRGCGASAPYEEPGNWGFTRPGLQATLEVLQEKGKGNYKRAIEDIKSGKTILFGFRNTIAKRGEVEDVFCDLVGYLPGDADSATYKKGDPTNTLFLATTCPSLSYYGEKPMAKEGVGIKAAGETLYTLKNWTPPGRKIPAYKALVEAEAVDFYRYTKGTLKYSEAKTYKPGQKSNGHVGMHIHKSSTGNVQGICVGPWSAGCQVLGNGNDFDTLISYCEKTGQTNFIYALVEKDDYLSLEKEIVSKKSQIASAAKTAETKKS